jgi:hypothetical protein
MLTTIALICAMSIAPERALPPGKWLSPHHITRSLTAVPKPPYSGSLAKRG